MNVGRKFIVMRSKTLLQFIEYKWKNCTKTAPNEWMFYMLQLQTSKFSKKLKFSKCFSKKESFTLLFLGLSETNANDSSKFNSFYTLLLWWKRKKKNAKSFIQTSFFFLLLSSNETHLYGHNSNEIGLNF